MLEPRLPIPPPYNIVGSNALIIRPSSSSVDFTSCFIRRPHSPTQARQGPSPKSNQDDASATSPAYNFRQSTATPFKTTGLERDAEEASSEHSHEIRYSPYSSAAPLDARTRVVLAQLHNAVDALDLLTFAGTTSTQDANDLNGCSATTPRLTGLTRMSSQEPNQQQARGESAGEQRIRNSFILINKDLLSKSEAVQAFGFFFEKLWPLKPIVPTYYKDRTRHITTG